MGCYEDLMCIFLNGERKTSEITQKQQKMEIEYLVWCILTFLMVLYLFIYFSRSTHTKKHTFIFDFLLSISIISMDFSFFQFLWVFCSKEHKTLARVGCNKSNISDKLINKYFFNQTQTFRERTKKKCVSEPP